LYMVSCKEFFTKYMIEYYSIYGRNFEWRRDRTPFKVYLSEILLQRTRAEQVEPIFCIIWNKYKTPADLLVNFEEVQEIMYSLGRFIRFEKFKQGLIHLVKNFEGNIPRDKDLLLKVPSIGPYIAAAIRIFGFGLKDVIIDANVVRVLGRFFGMETTPETRRKKSFIELACSMVPDSEFVEYSYGILDFGSTVCKPRPSCINCNLRSECQYSQKML